MSQFYELIAQWRTRADEYDQRFAEATKRREHVIAAQQGGLASAFRVCANDLEAQIVYSQHVELRKAAAPPRRIDVERLTPCELAIRKAILMVEELPADERLTAAVILLTEAKAKVSDYVDGKP